MLRMGDVPGAESLCQQRILAPDDPYLADVHQHLEQSQLGKAMLSPCPSFHGNPPPAGTLPPFVKGRIPIATLLPSFEVLSIDIADACKNIAVVGPTGGGKTNWLKICIASLLEANP